MIDPSLTKQDSASSLPTPCSEWRKQRGGYNQTAIKEWAL